jgi:hypothetical protein
VKISSSSTLTDRPSGVFPFGINSGTKNLIDRTPWTGDQPVARPLPTQHHTNTKEMKTDVRGSSGFRTHVPSVRMDEDIR